MPVYRATSVILVGQRRILKVPRDAVEYIKKGVETGVYRTPEEIKQVMKERADSAEDLRFVMRRFRQDIIRGTHIHDYPVEYLIWEQHPRPPEPLRIPKDKLKAMEKSQENDPISKLTKEILKKQNHDTTDHNAPTTTEEYYRNLLGVQAGKDEMIYSSLRHKPAELQKAYLKAVKTYELQRTKNLSKTDAMAEVDELLKQASKDERKNSKVTREKVREWRRQHPQYRVQTNVPQTAPEPAPTAPTGPPPIQERLSSKEHLSSIFSNDPHTLEGMMRWGRRLQAVPYEQWTIGASTALDHWIATRLLQYTEETWNELLEGVGTEHLDKGRDLVAVRELLFPETNLGPPRDMEYEEAMEETMHAEQQETAAPEEEPETRTKTIDELLQSLGGAGTKESGGKTADGPQFDFLAQEPKDDPQLLEERIATLTSELQDWRGKNQEDDYDNWKDAEKQEFNQWMKNYVGTFASPNERVDYEETRKALLSSPPVSAEESDDFWGSLGDTEAVETFLDRVREDGPPPSANILQAEFWNLPRDDQLSRLLNLGALRPVLDEYTRESDRIRFLQRYGDALVQNVPMDHLIEDPKGSIQLSDLNRDLLAGLPVRSGARYRVVRKPFKSSGDNDADILSRSLFRAWNFHKAGRARYEEEMFKEGKLGLRYTDEVEDPESSESE